MRLFTIGYSVYDRAAFADALRRHGVSCVADVRSLPASGYRPEYNREAIRAFLAECGMEYRHMPAEFGARQEDKAYADRDGCVDFSRFTESEMFLSGVEWVRATTEAGTICALMCAEKDAMNCHRGIMIGRQFHEMGWRVVHISPDGDETHEAMEERLLNRYFPERYQMSLLDELKSDEELLKEAYRNQNRIIAYRREA